MLLKIKDLSDLAFVNIKPIESTTYAFSGLDHGVGHPLLLLYDVKAPNGQKSNEFNDLNHYPSSIS